MLGFFRKAKQQAEEIRNDVVDEMCNLLAQVTYQSAVANGFKEGDEDTKALLETQGKIVLGLEAIRAGAHPSEISDPLMRDAARLAFDVVGGASLRGTINQVKIADELRGLLSVG